MRRVGRLLHSLNTQYMKCIDAGEAEKQKDSIATGTNKYKLVTNKWGI